MRISDRGAAVAALLLLAACGDRTTDGNRLAAVESEQAAAAADAGTVPCARGGAALASVCTVDQVASADGLVLTVRHPDGGFHRLLVTRDGRGVVAADGAEAARVTIPASGLIDVAIGGDHYRLPATIKPAR
ncbi:MULTISPECIES: hypothetical protein [Sphingomonas]|uniref:Lipoprotein n=1 Tax=Sphingomonas kyungheensis TaxID=1069987 RepID=A0ABU8H2V2_9SPHN|nr:MULTISPECIES: hypothetical protein [unclassified Sphingomonas]EZP49059.1 putative lipoprotein [Sphingomonas sp. RIT328]